MNFEIKSLGTVATYVNGRAFKPDEWESDGLPIIRIQNLTDSTAKYNFSSALHDERFRVQNGDLLFAWSASLGAHIWRGGDAWLNQHIFKVIPNDGIEKMYLYYYLCNVVAELYSKTHGSGMVHITKGPFMSTPIPIPSVTEQKFIVARIEELFSELDNGVETLRKTKQQLAVYRQSAMNTVFQSVLQDAVTTPMGEVLSSIEGGKSFKCEEHPPHATEYGIVKVSAVTWGTYNEEESKTCLPNQFIESKRIKKGDFLFSRANTLELVGNCVVVENVSKNLMLSDKILRFHFKDSVIPKYVMYYLRTHEGKKQIQEFSTGNQESMRNIGQDRIKRITVPMCSTVIQDSAVHEIEARLSVCDGIEKAVDMALQQAKAMRQSILKQAFEVRM